MFCLKNIILLFILHVFFLRLSIDGNLHNPSIWSKELVDLKHMWGCVSEGSSYGWHLQAKGSWIYGSPESVRLYALLNWGCIYVSDQWFLWASVHLDSVTSLRWKVQGLRVSHGTCVTQIALLKCLRRWQWANTHTPSHTHTHTHMWSLRGTMHATLSHSIV